VQIANYRKADQRDVGDVRYNNRLSPTWAQVTDVADLAIIGQTTNDYQKYLFVFGIDATIF